MPVTPDTAVVKSRNKELRAVVVVALETGLRRGELLGLTWERVDMSRGVIRLEGRARGSDHGTKSGRRREVPMRQAVYAALTSLPEPHEGRVFKSRSIRTAFENAVKVAGLDAMNRLDGEPFTLHGCRHHFASWFMMRGGSLQALKELLGHADIKTTLIYAHLSPAHLRDEVVKTERGTEPVERITQEITQEPTDRQLMSRN